MTLTDCDTTGSIVHRWNRLLTYSRGWFSEVNTPDDELSLVIISVGAGVVVIVVGVLVVTRVDVVNVGVLGTVVDFVVAVVRARVVGVGVGVLKIVVDDDVEGCEIDEYVVSVGWVALCFAAIIMLFSLNSIATFIRTHAISQQHMPHRPHTNPL